MRGKALKLVIITGGVVGAIVIALGAKTLVDTSTVPPPKPYGVAMYDVYSALIPNIEESRCPSRLLGCWLNRLSVPTSEEVLIRVETLTFQGSGLDAAGKRTMGGELVSDERFKPAVDSAIADYLKRNTGILELQRKFNLPHCDLFTKVEQQSITKSAAACLAFQQKHLCLIKTFCARKMNQCRYGVVSTLECCWGNERYSGL